jgi:hypothetical protein
MKKVKGLLPEISIYGRLSVMESASTKAGEAS